MLCHGTWCPNKMIIDQGNHSYHRCYKLAALVHWFGVCLCVCVCVCMCLCVFVWCYAVICVGWWSDGEGLGRILQPYPALGKQMLQIPTLPWFQFCPRYSPNMGLFQPYMGFITVCSSRQNIALPFHYLFWPGLPHIYWLVGYALQYAPCHNWTYLLYISKGGIKPDSQIAVQQTSLSLSN